MGMTFVTVHAYPKAMRAAVAARGDAPLGLLGVTVLTSMDDGDLAEAGYAETVGDLVAPPRRRRARRRHGRHRRLAGRGGGGAGRSSGRTWRSSRRASGRRARDAGDQKRVATPAAAIRAGADYLVVGRPITAARRIPKATRRRRIVAEDRADATHRPFRSRSRSAAGGRSVRPVAAAHRRYSHADVDETRGSSVASP